MVEMLLQSLIPPYHLVMIGEGFSVLFAGDTYTRSRERERRNRTKVEKETQQPVL